MNHGHYMEMALRIAFERMGKTSPNPPVGTVIVKNDAIIATGGTGPYGSSHAEAAAITAAGAACAGADMYVTLEPCNHFGKTPPCTAAIKRAGISRVFIPALDPNPLVSGKGVAEMRSAGIDVILVDEMAGAAADLIRPFKKYILNGRPFVVSKSAITLDGRIATRTGDSRWISSEYSRYLAHRLRAKVDAVIVGKNTFLKDNPALDVRLGDFDPAVARYFREGTPLMIGRDNFLLRSLFAGEVSGDHKPLRVVMGLPAVIDRSRRVLADNNYIFFERRDAAERIFASGDRGGFDGINLCLVDAATPGEEVAAVTGELARRGVMFALLEGGGKIAGSFLDAGEIDQFLYFIAPRIAGSGPPPLAGEGVERMSDALSLHDVSVMPVKDDIIYCGYREPHHAGMP